MSVRSALAGRHLLITGATGFVGKVLLQRILAELPTTRVTVLVRPGPDDDARTRMGRLLACHPVFEGLDAAEGARVAVWEGSLDDVANPPDGALDVDLVVHLASRVDFEPTPADGFTDNLEGAVGIARLAAHTRGKRLVYVSTCYVAGLGSRVVPELPADLAFDPAEERERIRALAVAVDPRTGRTLLSKRAHELGFANGYTLTKAIAEHTVRTWPGLACTVVRPSIVEAAWDHPYRGFHEGFRTCAPLVGLALRGLFSIPAHPELVLDLVPVDQVARGLLLACASALSGDSGDVWQLASSASNPLTMDRLTELVELVGRTRGELAPSSRWLGVSAVGGRLHAPGRLAAALKTVAPVLGGWSRPATHLARDLERVQRAADLFAPFLLETDHRFVADRAARATAALPDDERDLFGFHVPDLDWRAWWTEAQIPGLQRHCFQAPPPLADRDPWPLHTHSRLKEVG
ncbi:MAG: SDR family oxidoreductase [Myxococcota bacterium]